VTVRSAPRLDVDTDGADPEIKTRFVPAVLRLTWVIVVAGIPTGYFVAGVGSRLAMLALRVTSPDSIRGVESDDGFTMGVVTLSGTSNLLFLGAVTGVIGAGVYLLVRPWLIGPSWFRRVTVALASGAVVGSMLVHADGVDFTLLEPTWFAIALFVMLPALFAWSIGVAVDWALRVSPPRTRIARFGVPAFLLIVFPPLIVIMALFVVPIVFALVVIGSTDEVRQLRSRRTYGLVVRSSWLFVAVLGAVALANDVRSLT
jgi:hypothetical protein